jgi:hypothetical protein
VNWREILLSNVLASTIPIAVLGFLLKKWISVRLEAESNKALERFKHEIAWAEKRREQAAEVAELFSLWLKGNYDTPGSENLNLYELQKAYWKVALWLDAPILQSVHKAFHTASHPGILHKEALIQVRRLLVGVDDPISAGELFHFDPVKPTKA